MLNITVVIFFYLDFETINKDLSLPLIIYFNFDKVISINHYFLHLKKIQKYHKNHTKNV